MDLAFRVLFHRFQTTFERTIFDRNKTVSYLSRLDLSNKWNQTARMPSSVDSQNDSLSISHNHAMNVSSVQIRRFIYDNKRV